MAAGLVLALTVVTLSVILWFYHNTQARKIINKIPGPPALPLIGNAHTFKDGYEGSLQILAYCEKYAKTGIMRLWIGNSPTILLSKANTVEVLLNTSTHLKKSKFYQSAMPWLHTGLLTSYGDKWKARRRLLTPTFHFKILADFMPIYNDQTRVMIQRLRERAGEKEPFDTCSYITLCTLDIICETAMGKNVNAQTGGDATYVNAVHLITTIIQNRMKDPMKLIDFIFQRTKDGRDHAECLRILHGFTRKVIEERSAELDEQLANHTGKVTMDDLQTAKPFRIGKQKRLAFLDMLLIAAKGGADIDHDGVQEEVDTFMFEGHDTTAAASNWCIFMLGRHPEIQTRAQEEQDNIFGGDDRDVTTDDLPNMKYLDRVIKEVLRFFPSVPMFGREIQQDCIIGGYEVPSGTMAMMIPPALHMDPEHFTEPAKFDPDRWLPENSDGRHPYCYIPFSAGNRNCIGQKFAMFELKVVISFMLRNFTVTSHQDMEDVHPVGDLILRPEKGLRTTLALRG